MKNTVDLLQALKAFFVEKVPTRIAEFSISPATEVEVKALEAHLDVALPDEYRDFLKANDVEFYFEGNFKVLTVQKVKRAWQIMTDLLEEGRFDDGRIEHHLAQEFGNWAGDYSKLCWWNRPQPGLERFFLSATGRRSYRQEEPGARKIVYRRTVFQ